jgi:hypothetical protein
MLGSSSVTGTRKSFGVVEILKKIRLGRRSASIDLPNFTPVGPRGFPLHLSHWYGAICLDVYDSPPLKSLEGISLDKSRLHREEHARLGQEVAMQRRVRELTCELEAAWALELREHDRVIVTEQVLATSTEWLALEAEREARALIEGQLSSRDNGSPS